MDNVCRISFRGFAGALSKRRNARFLRKPWFQSSRLLLLKQQPLQGQWANVMRSWWTILVVEVCVHWDNQERLDKQALGEDMPNKEHLPQTRGAVCGFADAGILGDEK